MRFIWFLVYVVGIGARLGAAEPAIDVAAFRDSAHHWREIKQPERVMQAVAGQPSYVPGQVREIAGNVLLFQRANGGWPKDYDMLAVLTAEQIKAVRDSHGRDDTTFDNHTTHAQVDYLARAYAALGENAWHGACIRGFDFMLAAQLPNGGWPQTYPKHAGFHGHVTLNDGVMMGVLEVLRAAATRRPEWAWLDEPRRGRAQAAVERGVACLLRCQIRQEGVATGWCQQHDSATFEAAGARTFELASVCPQETTDVCRFLMAEARPSPEIVRAVEAAVAWLERARLTGIRVERVKAPRAEFARHDTESDVVVVADPGAPPLWARHYEIGSNRPIFASRDGVKVYALAAVDRERRTGSGWYGVWPRRLLEREVPAWRARLAGAK